MNRAIFYLLDVFTSSKYGGNPLAVFPEGFSVPESSMQVIAKELNLSETVFLFPKDTMGRYPMRIFTPQVELPTAGHPSIGSAFYLSREINHPLSRPVDILLSQRIGDIRVTVDFKDNLATKATMHQPLPEFGVVYDPTQRAEVAALLSLEKNDLAPWPVQEISCGVPYLLVPLQSTEAVKRISFRLDLWETLRKKMELPAIYAFAIGGVLPDSDVHGRMFGPNVGILEDPATGSAQGPLACYPRPLSHQAGLFTKRTRL